MASLVPHPFLNQRPRLISTFAIQTYGCFSFIEYVPCQKCFIFNEIANKIPDNFTLN